MGGTAWEERHGYTAEEWVDERGLRFGRRGWKREERRGRINQRNTCVIADSDGVCDSAVVTNQQLLQWARSRARRRSRIVWSGSVSLVMH